MKGQKVKTSAKKEGKFNFLNENPKLKKFSKKIAIIVIIFGIIFGLLLLNYKIELDKQTLFQYVQFLLLACILGLLLDTRDLIKKCASKP